MKSFGEKKCYHQFLVDIGLFGVATLHVTELLTNYKQADEARQAQAKTGSVGVKEERVYKQGQCLKLGLGAFCLVLSVDNFN